MAAFANIAFTTFALLTGRIQRSRIFANEMVYLLAYINESS